MRAASVCCAVAGLVLAAGCKKKVDAPVYETIPVERRDIVVSAHATGTIQADTTVEVKTRASGEVLQLKVETGQVVKRGALLMQIDPRLTRNAVAQSQAALEAARVQLRNAEIQKRRSDSLLAAEAITVGRRTTRTSWPTPMRSRRRSGPRSPWRTIGSICRRRRAGANHRRRSSRSTCRAAR